MSGRLAGKVAVITGSGSGIGQSIAIRFASEGATVVVIRGVRLRPVRISDREIFVFGHRGVLAMAGRAVGGRVDPVLLPAA